MGHTLSPNTVRKLLRQLGYGRRANRKTNDGRQHADRDAQFEHINAQLPGRRSAGDLGRHQELVGNYTNKGTEYRPEGQPRRTEVHDFESKDLGKVVPYGVYDLADNSGWVSVGVTSGPWQRPPGGTLPSSRSTPSAPGSTTRVVPSIPGPPG